ncbi:MAG: patatin-like phospholipase family protein [Chitinophagaceae bacterium]|nr:patatin-like phospholipase family protein [Chitinophagaceae bacterium]
MLNFLKNLYYSFPIQLLILHFRKYQVLLIFWYILFSTIGSGFMKNFGADALFLAPEYLGNVNAAGGALVGISVAIYIMSWNITTFILHSKRCRFLATTSQPFLKYCINNGIIPLVFIIFYFVCAYHFDIKKELIPVWQFIIIVAGSFGGFSLLLGFSFAYFFSADRRIVRTIKPLAKDVYKKATFTTKKTEALYTNYGMKVGYYFDARFKLRKARDVRHYGEEFLEQIFKRHHFSAMISVIMAFIFMVFIGFFLDNKIFQVPAAASIIILFALMIAVIGALAYFLESWSILFVILLFLTLDILYRYEIIDPRNKAYGLNYNNRTERPLYSNEALLQLCDTAKIASDKNNMLQVLNNWKARQGEEKPVMVFLNFSGGGVRSASFAMNILQGLDSISNGSLFKKTFLITGASGGTLSAAYFRELYRQKQNGAPVNLQDRKYMDAISGDLLNPIFSSMIARDLFSPAQKFSVGPYRYVKDRGYAFEQKLNENTGGILDKPLNNYVQDEKNATIPMIIFNSVITRDGRKLMICTQPLSFLMQSDFTHSDRVVNTTDAVDFSSMFARQDPMNIRVLSALRMNATFPYVLPSVWLPSNPIIDVMDAGMRDNFGQETSLRFISVFKEWIKQNTSGVLLIQIRDRNRGGWERPLETNSIGGMLTKPASVLQSNWYKLQDYFQNDQITYAQNFLDSNFHRITFMYLPQDEDKGATLNFHLTAIEKNEIIASIKRPNNQQAFAEVKKYLLPTKNVRVVKASAQKAVSR